MIKSIQRFVADFVGMFIMIIGSAAIVLCELITQTIYVLQKLWYDIIVPNTIEVLADTQFICCIIWQSILWMMADSCLFMSKLLLMIARNAHKESERMVNQLWMQ